MSATNSCACSTSLLLPASFFYAVVCWGGSIKKRDAGRLDRLVRKAGAAGGPALDCLTTTVVERRTLSRLLTSWTMTPTHYTVLKTDRGAHSVADSCHCHAHRTG